MKGVRFVRWSNDRWPLADPDRSECSILFRKRIPSSKIHYSASKIGQHLLAIEQIADTNNKKTAPVKNMSGAVFLNKPTDFSAWCWLTRLTGVRMDSPAEPECCYLCSALAEAMAEVDLSPLLRNWDRINRGMLSARCCSGLSANA